MVDQCVSINWKLVTIPLDFLNKQVLKKKLKTICKRTMQVHIGVMQLLKAEHSKGCLILKDCLSVLFEIIISLPGLQFLHHQTTKQLRTEKFSLIKSAFNMYQIDINDVSI